MSRFINIYEVRRNRSGRETTTLFDVRLPELRNDLDNHIFGAVSGDHTFLRCSCRRGERCFICQPRETLGDLQQEFENDGVPNITINIADAIRSAMNGEQPSNNVSVIPEYKAEEKLNTCAICLETIRKRQKFRALPCSDIVNHRFHTRCIDSWLKNNNSCPECRANVFQ